MKKTRTLQLTMDESYWELLDTYHRLLEMKIRRKGGNHAWHSQIVSAILVRFLLRHGKDIVDAYTDAKNRKKIKRINAGLEMVGMDVQIDTPTPRYPVPDINYEWNRQYCKTYDPEYNRQKHRNMALEQPICGPFGRGSRGLARRSGAKP